MYIRVRKMLILAATLAILTMPVAAAESEPSLGDWISDLWQTAQDKAPGAWDAAKDKGSELLESAKEKVPEAIDKAKDGLHNAQDAISSWNQDQQDQFWQWTESMQSGGSQQTPTEASPAQPDVAPNDPQPVTQPDVPPSFPEVGPNAEAPLDAMDASEPSANPDNATNTNDTEYINALYYDGRWYREALDGEIVTWNGQPYILIDESSSGVPSNASDAVTSPSSVVYYNGHLYQQVSAESASNVVVTQNSPENATPTTSSNDKPMFILLGGVLAVAVCLAMAGMALRRQSERDQWRN